MNCHAFEGNPRPATDKGMAPTASQRKTLGQDTDPVLCDMLTSPPTLVVSTDDRGSELEKGTMWLKHTHGRLVRWLHKP